MESNENKTFSLIYDDFTYAGETNAKGASISHYYLSLLFFAQQEYFLTQHMIFDVDERMTSTFKFIIKVFYYAKVVVYQCTLVLKSSSKNFKILS